MVFSSVRIRHFRSIKDVTLEFGDLSAICGPNSSGKSNILKAIMFAFEENITQLDVQTNLNRGLRDQPGGPNLSIWVDIKISKVSQAVADLAGVFRDATVTYSFRATRSGTIVRKLGNRHIDNVRELSDMISIIYIPPIRDLSTDGMNPFIEVFSRALKRSHSSPTLKQTEEDIRSRLVKKGATILKNQSKIAGSLLGADTIDIDATKVTLNDIYKNLGLIVTKGDLKIPLDELGTGHQSSVIINFYRQLGKESKGDVIFLLEEPDNHLHPSTIRAIARYLVELGDSAQVLMTTHSPIMLSAVGLGRVQPVVTGGEGYSEVRKVDLRKYSEKDIRHIMGIYGLKATEPLVSSQVVLCEGPLDAAVIGAVIECSMKRTADELGLCIIPAGGKNNLVRLAELLTAVGCRWVSVLDGDAATVCSARTARSDIPHGDIGGIELAVASIVKALDIGTKRGRNVMKDLERMLMEMKSGKSNTVEYMGSPLQLLLTLRKRERSSQKAIDTLETTSRVAQIKAKAKDYGVWLWDVDLEAAVLVNEDMCRKYRQELSELGAQNDSVGAQLLVVCSKAFSDLAHRPETVNSIIVKLWNRGAFKSREVGRMSRWLSGRILN